MGRTTLAAALACVALAGCGGAEDDAREGGEAAGEATAHLVDATTPQAARDAVTELQTAVRNLDDETREVVARQTAALSRAVAAFRQGDEQGVDALRASVTRVVDQGLDAAPDEEASAFWKGFRSTFAGN